MFLVELIEFFLIGVFGKQAFRVCAGFAKMSFGFCAGFEIDVHQMNRCLILAPVALHILEIISGHEEAGINVSAVFPGGAQLAS